MRLVPDRFDVRGGTEGTARWNGEATVRVGPLEVEVWGSEDEWSWTLANRGDASVAVDAVALVHRVVEAGPPLRMFRNGYQSWSPTGMATFGVDRDPSLAEGAPALAIGMHHADQSPAAAGELRSELFTVLTDSSGDPRVVLGFAGGWEHDGTFRLRDGDDGPELWVEAHLGGAVLGPGEQRSLHSCAVVSAPNPFAALDGWAGRFPALGARTTAPYQVGWCSWYHYFHDVCEADVRHNLALGDEWPFTVFQVDDGYQSAIGDWLSTNERFPSPLPDLASAIAAHGRTPGIWIAPFVAAPSSVVAQQHPDWFARWPANGKPLLGAFNPAWGGAVHTLDTTNAEVLDHLEQLGRDLVAAGFPYLKLDFTYAPHLAGTYADPSRTPAQRVRAGYDAIRRGAGDAAFLLGCGAPLGPCIGAVDGMRIGADVAPWWDVQGGQWRPAGYEEGQPATVNAWRNTLTRSFLHRRLWLNDPDCLMLRTSHTQLHRDAARAWALAVGVSGGMALVSDDLALLDGDAHALLDEVLELGRASDAEARAGSPARCDDLLDSATPSHLSATGVTLVGDPDIGTAVLEQRLL
ncbi:MAG: alpha-galactosidase [Acidimicrobiaceae bacterium]